MGERQGVDTSVAKTFSASFAKWRYETVAHVCSSLAAVRQISERVVALELFNNPQDRNVVEAGVKGCRDAKLQSWIAATDKHLWHHLEGIRRWGMTCSCPHHIQQRLEGAKHIECPPATVGSCTLHGTSSRKTW